LRGGSERNGSVPIPEIEMALGTVSPCPDEWLSRQEAIWEREGGSLISWEELKARLLWTNPYQVLAELPSKITVTEWRHRLEEMYGREEEEAGILPRGLEQGPTPEQWEESDIYTPPAFELPKFFTGRRLDGTERGRAVHLVMMKLNLTEGPLDEARLRRQIDRLVSQGVILPDEAELVSVCEMARFFASDLGKQVILAAKEGHLRREVPFTIGLPVAELYPELTFRAPQDGRSL
jgi:ATP-dependent helicase/nuclease subunit A